jgi:hypothetical protein
MIQDFIQKYLTEKLVKKNSLMVYDPELFYRDLVVELKSDNIMVFDASKNVVTAREDALDYWVNEMPKSLDKKLIFYVPFSKKIGDDQRAADPFIIFSAGGVVFPDEATDNYKQLCLAALPGKASKIEELFSLEKYPSFSIIDALEDGNTYPKLKSGLNATSESEILMAFLNPTEKQKQFLLTDKTWFNELKEFINNVLAIKIQSRNFEDLQKELWRITLFSEFVFDLPIPLPSKLKNVAVAKESSKPLVLKVCKQLRNMKDAEERYVNFASEISLELGLSKLFANESNLGDINTFAFEDTTYFNQFKDQLTCGNIQKASEIAEHSSSSIWSLYNDERRAAWQIGIKACDILSLINHLSEDHKKTNQLNDIVSWYAQKGYKLDTLHRELEKEIQSQISLTTGLKEVSEFARRSYFSFIEGIQKKFQQGILNEGLQNISILHNIDIFDNQVEPLVKAGKKTVYFLADALRYELAVQLASRLERANFECEIKPSLSFVPTVTKFGMGALMPGAKKNMVLKTVNTKLETYLNGEIASARQDRLKYTHNILGDKVAWYWENDILNGDFKKKDLLFITTTEVDQAGENPDNAQVLIEGAIKKLLKAATILRDEGYEEFIVVADHGFVLIDSFVAGNNRQKPTGDWVLEKSRCVAGKGNADADHIEVKSGDIGVNADVNHFLFLKHYATYDRGKKFFHEGLSLQECITPYLAFRPKRAVKKQEFQVNITYKGKGSGSITTRRPSIEVACFGDMFYSDPVDVLIEAISNEKNVGSPAISEEVNSTTGYIEITPGNSFKITLSMNEDFEGKFTVYAKSPSTGVILSEITLETDYL